MLDQAKADKAKREARPTILVTTKERGVNDQAVKALARDDDLFSMGDLLVQLRRPPDAAPALAAVEEPTLREILSDVADWVAVKKPKGDEEAEPKPTPAHPPTWAVRAIAKRGVWPGVRPIR